MLFKLNLASRGVIHIARAFPKITDNSHGNHPKMAATDLTLHIKGSLWLHVPIVVQLWSIEVKSNVVKIAALGVNEQLLSVDAKIAKVYGLPRKNRHKKFLTRINEMNK